jgi:hypothetical protein
VRYFLSFLGAGRDSAPDSGGPDSGGAVPGGGALALGIPLEAAASLRYVAGKAGPRPGEEPGGEGPRGEGSRRGGPEGEEEWWFPVPRLFGFPAEEIRHGIVLKGEAPRRVLLLTAVEREIECSSRELYRPSRLLGGGGAYTFLTGLRFWTADSGHSLLLLLIDPFKLADEMAAKAPALPVPGSTCPGAGDGPGPR